MIEQEKTEEYKNKLEMFQAVAELNAKERELTLSQGHGKEYFWSVCLPPIGVYYFIKYLFFAGGTKEDVKVGVIALILTLIPLLFSYWFFTNVFSGPPSQADQKELIQLLK